MAFAFCCGCAPDAPPVKPPPLPLSAADSVAPRTVEICGWTVHVGAGFTEADAEMVTDVLKILTSQLQEIIRLTPAPAVAELKKVPLWISPPYPDRATVAEYHPDAGWLRANGRDPAMEKGVEFSNIHRYAQESRRMPLLVLHELAHACHDRVLGFDHPEILAAYQQARKTGIYDAVERRFGDAENSVRVERAYAITNEKEYFAESTEAFFGVNDFFRFTREDLQRHDPGMFRLVEKLWNAPSGTPRKSS